MPMFGNEDITDRVRRLNFFSLAIVIAYAIAIQKLVATHPIVNPIVDSALVFFTSLGFYQIFIEVIFTLVGRFEFLLKLYWGRLYVNGLWSYTYTLDGHDRDSNRIYYGIWRFEQTLYDTRIVGYGLDERLAPRSRVRSVTDMLANGSMHEFINVRSDSVDPSRDVYSRTSMYFELNKNRILRYPTIMRGHTIIYGGPLNGKICNNLFVRHENARTEEEAIEQLRFRLSKAGVQLILEEGELQPQGVKATP